ncbi:hypothetical protein, partial [Escherichia coli]|uniref:hypothetical protein n=2 Tax=Enterobacteriaceae TaxID=543 RepID=UPI001BFCC3FB
FSITLYWTRFKYDKESLIMKKTFLKSAVVIASVVPFLANAAESAGVDFTALTNAVSFDSVIVAIMSVAGILVGLYASIAGAKTVLRMIRGA